MWPLARSPDAISEPGSLLRYSGERVPMRDESIDPVCGMTVKPDGPHTLTYGGEVFRFCNPRCLAKFQAEPARYLEPESAHAEAPDTTAIYTCPMHPEVRQRGPGNCPICGMALEPLAPALADGADPELRDLQRRFWIGAALTVPLVALGMAEMGFGLQFLLATP